jgi:quercetin dioxygenase-like cupin family protein
MNDNERRVQVVRADSDRPLLELVVGDGEARAIIWPGMGAELRSLNRIVLGSGSRTVEQRHPGEAVYFLKEGEASIHDRATGEEFQLATGSMIHVEPDTPYEFIATGDGAEILGGPCPSDPSLYEHLGISVEPA